MKLLLAGIVLILIVKTNAQWYRFPFEAAQGLKHGLLNSSLRILSLLLFSFTSKVWLSFLSGAGDMRRAYNNMKEANTIGADKYFHARGNYDAAQRGAGGKWAAEVIR